MDEQNLIEDACRKFQEITGMGYQVETNIFNMNGDALVSFGEGAERKRFAVEAKASFRKDQLSNLVKQFSGKSVYRHLLISRYIPKPLKQELKERNICYLEASGNCFINTKGLIVYINDQPVTEVRQATEGRLWHPAGLKFLFAVLQNPDFLNLPYRTIAGRTGLGLGTIGPLLDDLKSEGYLAENLSGRKPVRALLHRQQLIEKWSPLFYANLRPRLVKGTYRFLRKEDEKAWMDIPKETFFWGGENAGALLTKFLKPQNFSIYTSEPNTHLMKQLKLVPDRSGNIQVLEKFWGNLDLEVEGVVPALLAYAELDNSLDSRCHETAARIKEKYIYE